MRNYLESPYFLNIFPRNPTQTRYIRFMKQPWSPLTSDFDRIKQEWDRAMREVWRTRYLEEAKDVLL